MTLVRLFRSPFPRLGSFVLVAALSGLVSCADDDMCTVDAHASVDARLDSAVWTYRAGDSSLRGRIAGRDESRIRHWIDGGWYTWASRQTARPYVSDLSGQVVVGGRLGHPDTLVYYAVDSMAILSEERRMAGIRLQFRSTIATLGGYHSYGPYATQGGGDTLSTYWNLRGQAECTVPLDAALGQESSFSCTLRTTSPEGMAFHLTMDVVNHGPSEYNCTNHIAEGLSAPREDEEPRVGSGPI